MARLLLQNRANEAHYIWRPMVRAAYWISAVRADIPAFEMPVAIPLANAAGFDWRRRDAFRNRFIGADAATR